jgi:hypothetical protein
MNVPVGNRSQQSDKPLMTWFIIGGISMFHTMLAI